MVIIRRANKEEKGYFGNSCRWIIDDTSSNVSEIHDSFKGAFKMWLYYYGINLYKKWMKYLKNL